MPAAPPGGGGPATAGGAPPGHPRAPLSTQTSLPAPAPAGQLPHEAPQPPKAAAASHATQGIRNVWGKCVPRFLRSEWLQSTYTCLGWTFTCLLCLLCTVWLHLPEMQS